MLLEYLKSIQGQRVFLELVNGRILPGTVKKAEEQYIILETDHGVATVPVDVLQIVWELPKPSVTHRDMEEIAARMRESAGGPGCGGYGAKDLTNDKGNAGKKE